jgi:membrane-associated phospholipid phosphatase
LTLLLPIALASNRHRNKTSDKEERPDQSDNLSFPSGHTAIAFTNAAPSVFHEYQRPAIRSSGFLFATATDFLE